MTITDEIISSNFGKLVNMFISFGYFAEPISFIFVSYFIWIQSMHRQNSFVIKIIETLYYIFGISISTLVNKIIKNITKSKRPDHGIKFLAVDKIHKNSSLYGFPSGHSQNTMYSLSFIYFFFRPHERSIYILFTILMILLFYQRYYYRNHTFTQLVGGAIIGTMLGWATVKLYYEIRKQLHSNSLLNTN